MDIESDALLTPYSALVPYFSGFLRILRSEVTLGAKLCPVAKPSIRSIVSIGPIRPIVPIGSFGSHHVQDLQVCFADKYFKIFLTSKPPG